MDKNSDTIQLCHLPTPFEKMHALSRILDGPKLFIKRDDCTGLALGGNKSRKLEYLCRDAVTSGADTLITAGAMQSNHCRQTAAAAARCGLHCVLLLGGEKPDESTGNVLLDQLLGASIVWCGNQRKGETLDSHVKRLVAEGRHPYIIPYGGSNPLGAIAYYYAMVELLDQCRHMDIHIDHIILATSSGGTQAGLAAGAASCGYTGTIRGVSVDRTEGSGYEHEMAELACAAADILGSDASCVETSFLVDYGYLGQGYARPGMQEIEAIKLFARAEGILLDPVYTGRAAGALLNMIEKCFFSKKESILFWHTGGTPSLFSFNRLFET